MLHAQRLLERLATLLAPIASYNKVYNVAYGEQTSLNQLFNELKELSKSNISAKYGPEREGDVKHSLADISMAKKMLKYKPEISVKDGLKKTFEWYKQAHE